MNLRIFLLLAALLLSPVHTFAALDSASPPGDKTLRVSRITPAGEDVPPGRQIVFQFDRPVVPVGAMDRKSSEIPVTISPALECEWRWLNTSALACQLGEKQALTPATRYQITMRPGITTEDGATLAESVAHSFITERPQVNFASFSTWRGPGTPVIRAVFNQPVVKDSAEKYLDMVLASGQRVALNAESDPNDSDGLHLLPLPGENLALLVAKPERRRSDDQARTIKGREARRVWLLTPAAELPLDTHAELTISPGLVSALGPEPGVESRQVLRFDTFPQFRFKGIRCYTKQQGWKFWKGDDWTLIEPGTPLADQPQCYPLNEVSLVFSAPVANIEIKENVTFAPDLAGGRSDYDPWAGQYQYELLGRPHRADRDYYVSLPELLKAYQEYGVKAPAKSIRDAFGRKLAEPIDLSFMTAHRQPDVSLVHSEAVLEKQEETDAAFLVTNIDSIDLFYQRLTTSGKDTGQRRTLSPPAATDIAYYYPMQLRSLLDKRSGVVQGTFSTSPKVEYHQERFFAQVTPFQVHVKLGHYNTLVWVTDLASGAPVKDARVRIYPDTYTGLTAAPTSLAEGSTDKDGLVALAGTATIDPQLAYQSVWSYKKPRLFVRVDRGDDLALLPLDSDFALDTEEITQYRIYSYQNKLFGHLRSWGTTAQGVYRAGDTIQYKFYVRNQDNERLVAPPLEGYTLEIFDPTDKVVEEVKNIKLSSFGAYAGELSIPQNAPVGWYSFKLSASFTGDTWQPMRVLVSDFTPSPFRVRTDVNGDLFRSGDRVEISTQARLHAGGPYVDARTRVTATLTPRAFEPKGALAATFTFDTADPEHAESQTLYQDESTVDGAGNLSRRFTLGDPGVLYGSLTLESAVQDDRGKSVAGFANATYVGRDRFVGLRQRDWLLNEDRESRLDYLVVDDRGREVAGVPVDIAIERRVTKAARVKGAGNAYLTTYSHEWQKVDSCRGRSAAEAATCRFTPDEPGSYRLTASIKDTKGRPHATILHAWAAGKGQVIWEQPEDNSLEILPEKESYQVGETARYLVKNPYPGARALISVERFGVIKRWVETFDSSTPVVSFKVEPDFLPGYYLSVLVVSPRADKPLGPDRVDLGKPAQRMGYVQVDVRDPYKEIEVKASTDREVYKPRERVKVKLHAAPRKPGAKEPVELAVAVLDEAVFDLISQGRAYFDPYRGFYSLDSLDLKNFNLLTRLVGRQKFEKKGANSGGDGDGASTGADLRSIFKFVSYWNPSITTDAKGNAMIDFEVPDNLTGWRILALAVTPSDRLGLGEASFKVNRPTELRPVMPNQVTEGDSFTAGFTVMNRTSEPRTLKLDMKASGALASPNSTMRKVERIVVPPFKRQTIQLPLTSKGPGSITFTATAGDKLDRDGLTHTVPVRPRRSLETGANYGTTTGDKVTESLLYPANIHPDAGGLSVVTYPTVLGNLSGAFGYLRDYPYACWEQQLTKAVMAAHYQSLKSYLPADFAWPESRQLPQEILDGAASFQAPNGGMAFWLPMNDYVSPYLSAYTALAFNWLRASGHRIPEAVEKRLHDYLAGLLRRDAMPTFYSQGMSSTVRAVALAALAERGMLTGSDIDRYAPHAKRMSLFGQAHFLTAALKVGNNERLAGELADLILAKASQSGGKFQFNETRDDGYSRLLATPLRANCAVLSSFTAMGETPAGAAKVGDIPFKLVRSITQSRANRDHWQNTQENMFCMNALVEYSRVFEKETPAMTVQAYLDQTRLGETTFKDLRDKPVTFARPMQAKDVGRKAQVRIEKKGQGRLYYATRLSYAPTEEKARRINSGIEIRREYAIERDHKWQLLTSPMTLRRGDLVRVDLFISLPTARHFVVVDDPVPGGLEPVNRDLATASLVDADKGEFAAAGGSWWFEYSDWSGYGLSAWSFYHKELRHDAARFYADYLPAGNYHLSYTAQAIAPGRFTVMPVHAEEMYDPDVFGKGLPATLLVEER